MHRNGRQCIGGIACGVDVTADRQQIGLVNPRPPPPSPHSSLGNVSNLEQVSLGDRQATGCGDLRYLDGGILSSGFFPLN